MTYSRGLLAKFFSFLASSSLSFSASVTSAAGLFTSAGLPFSSLFSGPAADELGFTYAGFDYENRDCFYSSFFSSGFVWILKDAVGFGVSDGLAWVVGVLKRPFSSGLLSGFCANN